MPGTYTENPTLVAGVNLCAFGSDSGITNGVSNVIIKGTCTLTTAGTVSIYGVQLLTNSSNFLAVTGTLASIVNLHNCYLNCLNNTGITYTSSNASSKINILECTGNLGTTGIALYSMSSTGVLTFNYSSFLNSGNSTTASTNSAGSVQSNFSTFGFAFSNSSISSFVSYFSNINLSSINTIAVTANGTGTNNIFYSQLFSGSASSLSIGTGASVTAINTSMSSTNTDAITGLGTLVSSGIIFVGSSNLSNVTAQTGGVGSGLTQGTAPSIGYVGEQIRTSVASGSAVSVSTGTVTNIAIISLTPGVWDISGIISYNGITTGTQVYCILAGSNSSAGTVGDSTVTWPLTSTTSSDASLTVPSFRVTTGAAISYYLNAYVVYTVGSCKCYGRISATRVG